MGELNLLSIERREAILEFMRQKNAVSVTELSKHFYISEATIRRDLEKMFNMGLVKRTYGGAVLIEGLSGDLPFVLRENESKMAKERIAATAAKIVSNGYTLFLDSSSSVIKLAPYIAGVTGLTVVTNGPKTALKLGEYRNIDVYCTGGKLRENALSLVGVSTRDYCENCNVDIAFFSCRGISLEKGVTDSCREEAEIKKQIMKTARLKVLLCDSSKFNMTYFGLICAINELDYFITDGYKDKKFLNSIENAGVKVLTTG
jgi:DeoR/GlpR family transcriptional regulator of sugar metabolism